METYTDNYISYRARGDLPPKLKGNTMYYPTPESQKSVDVARAELAKFRGDHMILDLRGNIGGDPFIFYDALRPILPQSGVLLEGVNRQLQKLLKITVENDLMTIDYGGTYRSSQPVRPAQVIPNIRVTVKVNVKSQSASQFIALILLRNPTTVLEGVGDKDLTTICDNWAYEDTQIPMYRFLDEKGRPIEGLGVPATWSKGTPRFNTPMEQAFLAASVTQVDMPKIDEPPYVCYEHEFAALRFRYSPGNRHIRVHYKLRDHPPVFKDGVVFMPSFDDKERVSGVIKEVYGPIWAQMQNWKGDLIVDCRGFAVEGKRALMCFGPMIPMMSRITLIVDEFVAAYSEWRILGILNMFRKKSKAVIGRFAVFVKPRRRYIDESNIVTLK